MIQKDKINIRLQVDHNNQWFASIWVKIGTTTKLVRFKIDTGCNAVVLSHSTLESFGISTGTTSLSKLTTVPGTLASGVENIFKKLGKVSLYKNKQALHICDIEAICHSTHETNDLLGTEVFRQFSGVLFNLVGDRYMELN